ncbi:MAG: glycosyltransferase family 39 protein [Bacillota bacterium]|nr:glycosyltransferase family 39 protein [Bacillota bacterium]
MDKGILNRIQISTKVRIILLFSFFSLSVLFFCSKSSPLFRLNDWPDVNSYFTMGKGLFSGKVIYKDIFDHKGPLLYLLYGIGYLISHRSFLGVYFIQSVSLFVVLFYNFKTANLFLEKRHAFLVAAIMPVFIFNYPIYISGGGSPEEFIMAFQAVSMFYFLQYLKNTDIKEHNPKVMFIHGIMAGCVLMLKYTALSFWIGFGIFVFVPLLIKGLYKNFFKNLLALFAGVAVVVVPWLLYFIITAGIKDFYNVYFKFNSLYAELHFSLGAIKTFIRVLVKVNLNNFGCFLLFAVGMAYFVLKKGLVGIPGKLGLICSFGLTFFVIYFSGISFSYYYLPVTVFAVTGLVALCCLFLKQNIHKWVLIGFMCAAFLLTLKSNSLYKQSRLYIHTPMLQEKFTEIMKKDPNPTVLNLLTQDNGFSILTDSVPNTKYFYVPIINYSKYPQIVDTQYSYVKDKTVEYVVMRTSLTQPGTIPDYQKPIYDELNKNYTLVSSGEQYCIFDDFRYDLYKVK